MGFINMMEKNFRSTFDLDMSSSKRRVPTITAQEMREINRSSILEMIRCYGPISRTQIAEDLQASLPTVMRIVEELMAEGLVAEDNKKEWSGGRKRKRVIFNGSQHLVIGIDLGGTKIYGAVADFNGHLLHEIRLGHHETQAEESLDLLCEVIDQLLAFARTTEMRIRGIGIGVPGVVQTDTGVVSIAPKRRGAEIVVGATYPRPHGRGSNDAALPPPARTAPRQRPAMSAANGRDTRAAPLTGSPRAPTIH